MKDIEKIAKKHAFQMWKRLSKEQQDKAMPPIKNTQGTNMQDIEKIAKKHAIQMWKRLSKEQP